MGIVSFFTKFTNTGAVKSGVGRNKTPDDWGKFSQDSVSISKTALKDAQGEKSYGKIKYYHKALREISEKTDNQNEKHIAEKLLGMEGSTAGAAAAEACLKVFIEEPSGGTGQILARMGRRVNSMDMKSKSSKANAGKPIMEAIMEKAKEPEEKEIASAALSVKGSQQSLAAYNCAFNALASGIGGALGPALVDVARGCLNYNAVDYTSSQVKASEPFIEKLIEKSAPTDKLLLEKAKTVENTYARQNSYMGALDTIKYGVPSDEITALASAGYTAMSRDAEYDSYKAAAGMPFLQEINKRASDPVIKKMTEKALALEGSSPRRIGYTAALKAIRNGYGGGAEEIFVVAAGECLDSAAEYESHKGKAAAAFISGLKECTKDPVVKGLISKIEAIDSFNVRVPAYREVIRLVQSGTGNGVKQNVARAGLKAIRSKAEYDSYRMGAAKLFLDTIKECSPSPLESGLIDSAFSLDSSVQKKAAMEGVLDVIASGMDSDEVVSISRTGKKILRTDMKYDSSKAKAAAPFVNPLKAHSKDPVVRAVVEAATKDGEISTKTVGTFRGVFDVLENYKSYTPEEALIRAGLTAINENLKYDSSKAKAALPFLEKINEMTSDPVKKSVVGAALTMEPDSKGKLAYEAALKALKNNGNGSEAEALAEAGYIAVNGKTKYAGTNASAAKPFLERIAQKCGDPVQKAIAGAALKLENSSQAKGAYTAAFRTIRKNSKGGLTQQLAETVLEALNTNLKYESSRAGAAQPFMEAVKDNATLYQHRTLTGAALMKTESSAAKITHEAAARVILQGVDKSEPVSVVLAKAGARCFDVDTKYRSTGVEAAEAFMTAIAEKSHVKKVREMAANALKIKGTDDKVKQYKKTFDTIKKFTFKAFKEEMEDMVKTGRAEGKIVENEKSVVIDGVTLGKNSAFSYYKHLSR